MNRIESTTNLKNLVTLKWSVKSQVSEKFKMAMDKKWRNQKEIHNPKTEVGNIKLTISY